MTNEELAAAIREGHTELCATLWSQIDQFVKVKANDYLHGETSFRGATVEDLQQSGYLAMVAAVNGYDPNKGVMFLTYFELCLRTQFAVACGSRSHKTKHDPIHSAVSLDQAIDEDGITSLIELQPDLEDKYQDIEDKIQNEQLHNTLEKALNQLTEGEAVAIRKRFYEGATYTDLAKKTGKSITTVTNDMDKSLRKLRARARQTGLDQFIDQRTNFYISTNFEKSFTSPVERIVLLRERIMEEHRRRLAMMELIAAGENPDSAGSEH